MILGLHGLVINDNKVASFNKDVPQTDARIEQ